jgi:hypothetical protein
MEHLSSAAGRWSLRRGPADATLLDLEFRVQGEPETRVHRQLIVGQSASIVDAIDPSGARSGALVRDAGTIFFDNYPQPEVALPRGASGAALFEPDPRYFDVLARLGMNADARQRIALALWSVSLEDVRLMRSAFPSANLPTVLAVRLFGYSAQDAARLKSEFPQLQPRDITTANILRLLNERRQSL